MGARLKFRTKDKRKQSGKKPKQAQEPQEKDGDSPASFNRLRFLAAELTTDSFIVLTRYFWGMIGGTKSQLEISGEIGLGDPAATGIACGMAYGLYGAPGVTRIDIRPNFFETVIEGEVKLAVTAVPLVILMRTVKTAFHPALRRVWFPLVSPLNKENMGSGSIKGGV